jgi:DNA anti-recombination protein RmuC
MEDQNNNLGATLGEISTIRNILMGGHMQQYDQTFADINARFDANDKDKDERFQALEAQMNQRFELLSKEMNDRFDKLEALLADNVQKLNERVDTVSTTDKADLGRLLAEVSNRLING